MKLILCFLFITISLVGHAQNDTTVHNRLSLLVNVEQRFPSHIRFEALSDTMLKDYEAIGNNIIIYFAGTCAQNSCAVHTNGAFILQKKNSVRGIKIQPLATRFYVDTLRDFAPVFHINFFLKHKILSFVKKNYNAIASSPSTYSKTEGNDFIYIKMGNKEIYKKTFNKSAKKDSPDYALVKLCEYFNKIKFTYTQIRD